MATQLYVVKNQNGFYVREWNHNTNRYDVTQARLSAHEFQFEGVAQQVCDRLNSKLLDMNVPDAASYKVHKITGC